MARQEWAGVWVPMRLSLLALPNRETVNAGSLSDALERLQVGIIRIHVYYNEPRSFCSEAIMRRKSNPVLPPALAWAFLPL